MNIGAAIDKLYELRNEKANYTTKIREIEEEYKEVEYNLLAFLNEQELSTAKSKLASATVSTSLVPSVTDWDAFYKYILETEALFLLERRPSVTAYRDLLQAGETIPGTEPFTKTTLSLRKL
jgi:hypothetical protein